MKKTYLLFILRVQINFSDWFLGYNPENLIFVLPYSITLFFYYLILYEHRDEIFMNKKEISSVKNIY